MEQAGSKSKGSKMRMTVQRKIIHDELCAMKTHPTADEIYRSVKIKIPRISLGTVYRNLDILSQSGVIRKLDLGPGQRRYDGTMAPHYHVRCLFCKKVEDLPLSPTVEISKAIEDNCGYDIYGHDLEFFGKCPECIKNKVDLEGKLD